jgi:peptide/nickel transport system substrate-binding protein
VRLNLEHMRDPATKSPLAAAYIEPYEDGRVIDDFTFEARLREPYTPFLHVLAQSWLSMISPRQIRENPRRIGEAPVGSGPFVVERYTRQQGIRLVRRDDYHWSPPVIGHEGPAYLDRIELEFVPEALIRYTSLASGQYDFTIDAPAQNAAAIRADSSLMIQSRVRKGIPARAITFNVTREPFTDVRVRKAFALAVDREGIAQIMGFGEFKPKTDFLAANTPYYDPSFQDALKYDVPAANRLLDEAGWTARDAAGYRVKDGRRLSAEILVAESATPSALTVAMQSDVKKIGFDLAIIQLPAAQLTDRRNAGTYQALTAGVWHTNTPDALYILHHSRAITTPKLIGQNTSRLQDAELDALLTQARRTDDPAVLGDLYSRAQRKLTELVPSVPVYENLPIIAYRRDVKGVVFDTSHNTPVFTTVWLERETP